MDTAGKLSFLGNAKGVALVNVAIMLFVLIAVAGLAIDMGYMYVAKGQLQNAADAAALAGAAKLDGTPSNAQGDARSAAVDFSASNNAAGSSVAISRAGNSNELSPSNDVSVGSWDPGAKVFIPGGAPGKPVNAVKVRARRTSNNDAEMGASIGGPIATTFARALPNTLFGAQIFSDWSNMSAAAEAVAYRPVRANSYFLISHEVCNITSFPYKLSLDNDNMAWTTLNPTMFNTSASYVKDNYICPALAPDIQVCGEQVYTTQGTANTVFQGMEVNFYDPHYDRDSKIFDAGGVVTSWTTWVPVAPSNPALQNHPYDVWGYAKIVMSKVCGSGGGNPCPGRSFTAPSGVCDSSENSTITITSVTCVPCGDYSQTGGRASLAQ